MDPRADDLMPDETPGRVETRLARVPTSAIVVDLPGGAVTVLVDDVIRDQFRVDADQLFVGCYNRSGTVPSDEELRPSWEWDEQERLAMGRPPKQPSHARLNGDTLARPFVVIDRVGLAPLTEGRHHTQRAYVRIITRAWITHITIGSRAAGLLVAAALETPIKVAKGSTLTLGLRLEALLAGAPPPVIAAATEARALPPAPATGDASRAGTSGVPPDR